MRAVIAGVSLTVLEIFALTESSGRPRNLFSVFVPEAAPVQYSPQAAYGTPKDVQQSVQPVAQPVVQPHVATLAFAGRRAPPAPEVEGPPEFLVELQQLFILVLRLGTCALMVHHGFDKIQNVDGFSANVVAKFFGFLPGPPQFWTLS